MGEVEGGKGAVVVRGGGGETKMMVMQGASWLLFVRETKGGGELQGKRLEKRKVKRKLQELMSDKEFMKVMAVRVGGEGRITKKRVEKWMEGREGMKEIVWWECANAAGQAARKAVEAL